MKPVVYIASPYTKGDPAINTHFQALVFHELLDDGKVWPVIPLTSHFLHVIKPRPYKDWVDYDLAIIDRMDACLRLNASVFMGNTVYFEDKSSGADGEVARFKELDKPVFYSKEDLYKWVEAK